MPSEDVRALPPWRRFHVRTTLLFGLPAAALLIGSGLASYRSERALELEALQSHLRAVAVGLATSVDGELVTRALERPDAHARLVAVCASLATDDPDLQSIYVLAGDSSETQLRFAADWVRTGTPAARAEPYDASGLPELRSAFAGPRVESELKTDAWGPSLSGYAPIRDASGRAVAVLGVDVDATSLARVDERALALTLPIHALALVVLAIAGVVLGRGVRKPIERMIEATRRIAAGDLSARVELARKDELGLLGRYFDRMAAQLEERERLQALFGRYVSEDVARRVLASPEEADKLGGEEREVTILFADLRRFSESLAERPAAEVIGELEGYLDAMTALVEEHGGCVLEMVGDAVLAVFGAPEALGDHPSQAVRAGLAMVARVEALRAGGKLDPSACARIGIHAGRVVAGNTGGRTRMKYCVVGDAVNVAARIQALNDELGTTLLVSGEVQSRLSHDLAGASRSLGLFAVKGREGEVAVHALA